MILQQVNMDLKYRISEWNNSYTFTYVKSLIAFSKALNLAEATKTLKNTQLIQ